MLKKIEQYAVFEIKPAHGKYENGVILGPYFSREEAEEKRTKYGYVSDNYYVDRLIYPKK